MSDIKTSALELIGNTPILELRRYTQKVGVTDAKIYAKLEYLNTAHSLLEQYIFEFSIYSGSGYINKLHDG